MLSVEMDAALLLVQLVRAIRHKIELLVNEAILANKILNDKIKLNMRIDALKEAVLLKRGPLDLLYTDIDQLYTQTCGIQPNTTQRPSQIFKEEMYNIRRAKRLKK